LRRVLSTYGFALIAIVAAVLLRALLDPVIGDDLPLVTLFGAVAAVVWFGGFGPAIVATILGYLACAWLFIPPRGVLLFDVRTIVGLIAYLFTCTLIIAIGHAMRIARQRATERGELLRVTLGSVGDAVITTDTEGRVTYVNAVAESLTGWTSAEAEGRPLEDVFRIVNEQDVHSVENPAIRALRDGTVVGLANHTVLIARDGVRRSIDDSAAPIKDESGRVSGCVLIFRDITEQRRAEQREAARVRDARMLSSIVATSDDAIISKTLDGIIQSWNDAAERLFGYTAEQAVGRHITLIIPPERIAEEDQIIASLRAGRRVDHFETERRRSDGTTVLVSLTVSPLKDDAGNVVGASKIVRDITRQRHAEAEREKFVTLIETSTDFIGICDLEATPIYINRAGLKMVGLDGMEEARRVRIADFFFPEDQARIMDEFFPRVRDTGHAEIDVRFRHFRTREARWMAYKVLKLTDTAGRAVGFATVSQDITERRQLEDHLRTLAADLSESNRRKNEFLATLSHELRNPLAPMSHMLEVLKRDSGDARTIAHALDVMERQLGQLVRLVDDLLDLNRITHNRFELRRETVELTTLIRQAVQASRPLLDAAGHELRLVLPANPIYLHADAVRLTQVFDNLLNNAGKYTSPGGTISVTADREDGDAVVTVEDTGVGIPADKLESIFDMFMQVDRSMEHSQGGLGIGLTLVKRLVEMHGGSVAAHSAGQGQGSRFTVRLPTTSESATAATPGAAVASDGHDARRILIVDDNRDAAASLSMLLTITGHETHVVHDGLSAVEAADTHRPEVILLDIGLPELNGYEVCRRVRAQAWGKDMAIIALTGWGQAEDRRRSHEVGFDGHIVKPVDYEALMTLLRSLPPRNTGATDSVRN